MSAVDRLNKVPDYNDLLKENQELKEKLDKYENPEDMTLMMMWCTEKVKDENEKLKKKYVNAVSDYETTMFEKEQLNSLVNSCQEEIRQLKKQLENKYEKVGTLTGELLYEENTKLIKENQELKKQVEEIEKCLKDMYHINIENDKELEKLKTQRKEFIKYLEDENKKLDVKANGMGASSERDELITNARAYRKNLQKYKSIIGDIKNEDNNI